MKRITQSFITVISLALLWQAAAFFGQLPSYILPTPTQVIAALFEQKQLLMHEGLTTLFETLIGLFCGILLGSLAAVCISFFRGLRYWFWPLLLISQAIPTFAIAPLLVIWLGYGTASKIAASIIMIFFPITSALHDGLRQTRKEWLELAQSMNAKKWRLFWFIRLPAALPSLASGIRIATITAPLGAITGEWVGSSHGLGYIMLNANARMQIDVMFAALIVIMTFSLLLYTSIDLLLRRYINWQ